MSGRWWRAYGRARHDPKLLKLSDRHFRWWFSLVCVASDNNGILPPCADLAVEFRVSSKVMTEALDALIAAGLFDHDETGIHPHNWNGLQYKSDVSNVRVKRYRERQCNVTRNVTVTPSETESDTEADTEQKIEVAPRRSPTGSRLPEDWQPSDEDRSFAAPFVDVAATAAVFRDYWHGVAGAKGRKLDWPGTWRNWVRREAANARPPPKVNGFAKPDAQTLPPSEPWEQRMYGWGKAKFWQSTWGPKPGESGCRVPANLIGG